MDISKICFNCMKGEIDDNGICKRCGKQFSDIKFSENYLPIGSFLREKYLMGKVLGEGGFGITYIGYDINLDAQVAIKEFFPRNYASRARGGEEVIPNAGEAEDFFVKQRERFLGEAKRLAKFRNTPAIVSVLDFFKDNGTAYLVMDYIDGMTLRNLLEYSGGKITVEETLKIIEPIMLALKEVHESGFIHRDISPDNIMISNASNRVFLIDFGTARTKPDEEKTISVFKKSGYTPPEQLRTKGNQGPWTDVYALCATIYRCIVGAKPLDVTDRLFGEKCYKPSEYGISIAADVEAAIMKGLEIHNEDRFQSIDELYDILYKSDTWKNSGDEEYTKVIEAVRKYKMQGDIRAKVERAFKQRQSDANAMPALFFDGSSYEDEHEACLDAVKQYKDSPEYKEAYDRYVKADPEYIRMLEYEKIKEVVRAYKASKNPNIQESQLIDDIMTEIGTSIQSKKSIEAKSENSDNQASDTNTNGTTESKGE